MADRKIEEYAERYGVSNNEAKRRLGRGRQDRYTDPLNAVRGVPVHLPMDKVKRS